MWWSKQTERALSFSPSYSATGTIESPVESPATGSAGATTFPAVSPKTDRVTKRETSTSDDLRLDAVIEGSISLRCKKLIVGETARATADVFACEVIVYGEIRGHVYASERVEIKRNATVTADLVTPRISIDPGAYFKGTVQIERRKKPRAASA